MVGGFDCGGEFTSGFPEAILVLPSDWSVSLTTLVCGLVSGTKPQHLTLNTKTTHNLPQLLYIPYGARGRFVGGCRSCNSSNGQGLW